MNSSPSKIELRRRMRALLKAFSVSHSPDASAQAGELLRRQPAWKEASAILFYAALPGELDLWPLLEETLAAGKTAALPRFLPESGGYGICQIQGGAADCAPGKYGIAEPRDHCPPFPLNRLDFILAPGIAFDRSGHRLGRGQGYYDRLLAGTAAAKCGVAWDEQVLGPLPAESHDVRMNFILTPTQWLAVPG